MTSVTGHRTPTAGDREVQRMAKRNIAREMMDGVKEMAGHRTGKKTLRSIEVKASKSRRVKSKAGRKSR